MLTAERLRELVSYDLETGVFTWRFSRRGASAGSVAGSLKPEGYIKICVDGVQLYAHQAAVLYVTGEMPKRGMCVDHIDGNKARNAWKNLRVTTADVNLQNQRSAHRNNKSCGLLGVTKNGTSARPWVARLEVAGKRVHLGRYETPQLAHAAYLEAKRAAHPGCTL
jgi:hypothetical protein